MNDRELLEFAAKAAGIELGDKDFTDEIGRKWGEALGLWIKFVPGVDSGCWWNPLADDGDALRLAVKLDLSVASNAAHKKTCVIYAGMKTETGLPEVTEHNADPYAATRRAIVRAAAEIGKAIP